MVEDNPALRRRNYTTVRVHLKDHPFHGNKPGVVKISGRGRREREEGETS